MQVIILLLLCHLERILRLYQKFYCFLKVVLSVVIVAQVDICYHYRLILLHFRKYRDHFLVIFVT